MIADLFRNQFMPEDLKETRSADSRSTLVHEDWSTESPLKSSAEIGLERGLILGLDTSHNKCSVAISDGDKIIASLASKNPSAQAEELMIMIEQTLLKADLSYDDINYLAACKGPGSFTGIRIGLAAARGIVMASKIRPIAISSFEAINFRTLHGAKKFDYSVVLINAYRSQVYAQGFDPKGIPTAEPALIDLSEVGDYVSQFKGIVVVAGSGLECIETLPSGTILLPRFPYPEARSICRLANMQIEYGVYSRDLSPLYIRLPDAKLPKYT